MTDCEGKHIQIGDRIITAYRCYGGGTQIVKADIIRFTKLSILVLTDYGQEFWCKSREVFKL